MDLTSYDLLVRASDNPGEANEVIWTRRPLHDAPVAAVAASASEPALLGQGVHRRARNDWGIGPITGHRLTVLFWTILFTSGLFIIQAIVWPHHKDSNAGQLGQLVSYGAVFWLLGLPASLIGLIGSLAFRHPNHLDEVKPIGAHVCFRIVSRGSNIEALIGTVTRVLDEMAEKPLFDFSVEVVVDEGCEIELLPTGPNVSVIVVPDSYDTPNGSLFKARALQYALGHSPLTGDAWLVHLDEETHPSRSVICGIAEMIDQEETSGRLRVGQGAILYHRNWKEHPILTLADMHRTGDDLARFHFQHKLGITIFGMHGSFIVVRNDIEKEIGFDFGPVGSITEDAFWALKFMESGGRSRWVDGHMEEQSTQGLSDFVKQRKRWFQGLILVGFRAPTSLRWRMPLLVFTLLWGAAPLAVIYTVIHAAIGTSLNDGTRALADFTLASLLTLYVVGLKVNLDAAGITNPITRFGWLLLQLILTPFFGVLESLGVLTGILRPVSGFHVVKK